MICWTLCEMPLRSMMFCACWGKASASHKSPIGTPPRSKSTEANQAESQRQFDGKTPSWPLASTPRSGASVKVQSVDVPSGRSTSWDHWNSSSSFDSVSPDGHFCRFEASSHRTCQLPPVPATASELPARGPGSPERLPSGHSMKPAPPVSPVLVEEEHQSESEGALYATVGLPLGQLSGQPTEGRQPEAVWNRDPPRHGDPGTDSTDSSVQPNYYSTVMLSANRQLADAPYACTATAGSNTGQRLQSLSGTPIPSLTSPSMNLYAQVSHRGHDREAAVGDSSTYTPQLPLRSYGEEEIQMVNNHRINVNRPVREEANQVTAEGPPLSSAPPTVRFIQRLRNIVQANRLRQLWHHRSGDSASNGSLGRHYRVIIARESLTSLRARNALPHFHRPWITAAAPVDTSTPGEYELVYGSPLSSEATSLTYEPLMVPVGNVRSTTGNATETRGSGAPPTSQLVTNDPLVGEHASDGYTEIEDCLQREPCGRASSRSSVGNSDRPFPSGTANPVQSSSASTDAVAGRSFLLTAIGRLRHVDGEATDTRATSVHYYSLSKDVDV